MSAGWQQAAPTDRVQAAVLGFDTEAEPLRRQRRGLRARAAPQTPRAGLRQLMLLRTIAVTGQTAAIGIALSLGVALPVAPMLAIVMALVVLNATMRLRLRAAGEPDSLELGLNLALDLTAFTLLLSLSGGIENPFHVLFVVHGVLIALLLPMRLAAIGIVLVTLCYVALLRFSLPLALANGAALPDELLLAGNCLGFVLTAAISAAFVMRIVRALAEQDRLLSEAAQRASRDEAIMSVGALAAGAAHELATPLTTMSVIASEMTRGGDSRKIKADAALLGVQIGICRRTLDDLMAAAGHARAVGGGRQRLDRFLDAIASQCAATHPKARLTRDWSGIAPAPDVLSEHALRQALLCFLNNAAEASPDEVSFSARRHGDAFEFSIADRGGGVSAHDATRLGRAFFTTKPPGKGRGWGVMLAARAIDQLGGTVSWQNDPGRGMRVRVRIPTAALQLGASR